MTTSRVLILDTTGSRVAGTPQILRGIWAHIYPGSPSPRFGVYRKRQPDIPDQYSCEVTLSSGGSDINNVSYTFSSDVCVTSTQAIQEVSSKAIIALSHRDPEMSVYRRYSFYPYYQEPNDTVVFPACLREEDPAIVHLVRYAAALHTQCEYLTKTVADTRLALANHLANQAAGINDPALFAPPPPPAAPPIPVEVPPRQTAANPPRIIYTCPRTNISRDAEPPNRRRRVELSDSSHSIDSPPSIPRNSSTRAGPSTTSPFAANTR